MSSLVTGGTGFLGRYVVRALMASDEPVIVLSRRPIDEAPYIVGDLTAPLPELSATSCEVVYHVAGRAHVAPRTEAGKERFFQVNAEGTRRLLHALEHTARRPQAVVLVSTVAVYGREAGELLDENTPRQAEDPYGLSKRIAEDILVAWG